MSVCYWGRTVRAGLLSHGRGCKTRCIGSLYDELAWTSTEHNILGKTIPAAYHNFVSDR